jgi:hypothetical protein
MLRNKPELLSQQAKPTLYSQLELDCFADIKLVKKAYYKLALIHHPDKGGNENIFKQIGHAYYVLGDPTRKAEYDELLRRGESTTEFTEKAYKDFDEVVEELFAKTKQEFIDREQEKTNIKLSSKPIPSFFKMFHPERLQARCYYIVGAPINISGCVGELRNEIPALEIQASFQHLDHVILFDDEYSALQYAWSTRQGNFYEDDRCYQSPVAKVKVLQPINDQPYSLDYWINEKYKDETDGAVKSTGTLICLNARMNDLELFSARMLIQTAKRGQFFREYPVIEFVGLHASSLLTRQ